MDYKYFDVHSHLNLEDFASDREAVMREMESELVGTITVGVDHDTSSLALEISKHSPFCFACIGMHPVDNIDEPFDKEVYLRLAGHEKVVAIGECGLDYFRTDKTNTDEINRQKNLFREQVELSFKVGKPLMIHARPSKGSMDAYEDVVEIFEEYKSKGLKIHANMHFFVGDEKVTAELLKFDTTFSFPGVITFARDYDSVIRMIPQDRILSETDSPFATPEPYRGKRNLPIYVKEVVSKLAELKGVSHEEMRVATVSNAKKFFGV